MQRNNNPARHADSQQSTQDDNKLMQVYLWLIFLMSYIMQFVAYFFKKAPPPVPPIVVNEKKESSNTSPENYIDQTTQLSPTTEEPAFIVEQQSNFGKITPIDNGIKNKQQRQKPKTKKNMPQKHHAKQNTKIKKTDALKNQTTKPLIVPPDHSSHLRIVRRPPSQATVSQLKEQKNDPIQSQLNKPIKKRQTRELAYLVPQIPTGEPLNNFFDRNSMLSILPTEITIRISKDMRKFTVFPMVSKSWQSLAIEQINIEIKYFLDHTTDEQAKQILISLFNIDDLTPRHFLKRLANIKIDDKTPTMLVSLIDHMKNFIDLTVKFIPTTKTDKYRYNEFRR